MDTEAEEQAYLRALLQEPDVRIYRTPGGGLGLEVRAMRMPEAARRVSWVWRRVWKESAESRKPYRVARETKRRNRRGAR